MSAFSTGTGGLPMKTERTANYLKAVTFCHPEWIPAKVRIMPASWLAHGDAIERIVLSHPELFPEYEPGAYRHLRLERNYRTGEWVDAYGIVWHNLTEGLDSFPVQERAPLRDWQAFDTFSLPDPLGRDHFGDPIDWEQRRREVAVARIEGGLAKGGLWHGAMYMILTYLRGFDNVMIDIALREPRLDRLIDMVLSYNLTLIDAFLGAGVESMSFGDDMGLQKSLPMSPADWRRYLKPCFKAMFAPCRAVDALVYLHSDGCILDIIPDLVECGLNVINPQFRANGFDGLRRVAMGKVCIDLDLDRQLFPFGGPAELEGHIESAVAALNLPAGGLMLTAEIGPDVPLANVEAICRALEKQGCRA